MTDTIKQVLMKRDKMSSQEADNLIDEAKTAMYRYIDTGHTDDAEAICEEYFGLEPDYIDELL